MEKPVVTNSMLTRRQLMLAGAATFIGGQAAALPDRIRFVSAWGKRGKQPGEFDSPIGIAIDRHDSIYVTEFKTNRVQKFDTEGRLLAAIPVDKMPGGIAVDRGGRTYVAHLMLHKISVVDDSGKLLFEFGKEGTGDGEFKQPGGIAIARDGSVYVADQVNRRVQRFTAEGKFIQRWGEFGVGPGQFGGNEHAPNRTGGPQFVAIDRKGFVYTTEGSVGRVQKFTPDGTFVLSWGWNSIEPGGFGGRPKNLPGPIGIVADRRNHIWVSSTNNRVQCFTDTGDYLYGISGDGPEPGHFVVPHGLAFDSQGFLYVVDAGNARIQKFSVGS
jgi:tripartite motif-containing protein 71